MPPCYLSISIYLSISQNYVLKLADMGEVREIHPADGSTYSKAPNPARNWAPPEVHDCTAAVTYIDRSMNEWLNGWMEGLWMDACTMDE